MIGGEGGSKVQNINVPFQGTMYPSTCYLQLITSNNLQPGLYIILKSPHSQVMKGGEGSRVQNINVPL